MKLSVGSVTRVCTLGQKLTDYSFRGADAPAALKEVSGKLPMDTAMGKTIALTGAVFRSN